MRQRVVALALIAALAALSARADEYSIAPAFTGETGLFTLSTGDTIEQGGWTFSIWLANLDRVLDLPVDDELRGFDRTTARVNIGYGVTDRFELFAGIPYEDLNFDSRIAEDETGIGNPRLGAKFRLSGERGSDRTLALTVFGEPATGDEAVSSEDAGFGAYLGWRLNKWVINLGFYEPGEREARFNAGVGYVTAVSENLDWITELSASIYDDTLEDAYDLTTGGRVWLGADRNVAFSFALRTDLAQADAFDEHCPIGGLVGIAFVPGIRRAAPVEPEPAPAPPPAPPPPPPTPAPPAPAPAPPPPAPAPPPEVRETIHFTAGSARLSNIAKAKLDEVALKMKQDPSLTAQIIGHSDAGGSASANDRMSQQRAEAAKAYLISRHGIDAARITSEGRGSAEATGNAAEDRKAVIILRVQ